MEAGKPLYYKMGEPLSVTGERMDVTLETVVMSASRFIKLDHEQNILYLVTERVSDQQIGDWRVIVEGKYVDLSI